MFHAKATRKWLLIAVLAVLCGTSAASAQVRGLSATLEADKTFLTGAETAVVRFTLRNDVDQDLYVLRWQTPLRGVEGNIFDVRVGGKPVAYTGRLYKRAEPTVDDYLRVPAGRSVSVKVDLSRYYDMSRTGEYSVRYQASVQDALRVAGTKVSAVGGVREVTSNVLLLGVERDGQGRFLQALGQPADDEIGSITGTYRTPSYVSCSSTRQSTLVSALSNAQTISQRARDYLNNVPAASRPTDSAYRTWFGSYTSSRYSTVQSHYSSIYNAFANQTVTFYCDCTDSSYAYVYANQPYRIHLCNAFWAAPMSGIDSKAGTLVHEMSHFNIVAGTRDYAYGTSACQSLANSNPTRAVSNADSHEYFAETR